MNIILQRTLIVFVIVFLIFVVVIVKKNRLQVKYSLLWITLGVAYLAMAAFPIIVDTFASLLHIREKVNALFLISIGFIFILCFIYNLFISNQNKKIRLLIQEISILKSEIKKYDYPF